MDLLLKMLESGGLPLAGLFLFWVYFRFFDENLKSLFNVVSQKEIEKHREGMLARIETLKSELQSQTAENVEKLKAELQSKAQDNIERLKADLQKENLVYQEKLRAELQQKTNEIGLLLARRSKFEEKILLDRYELVRGIEHELENVATNLNRLRHGMEVPGFIVEGDIVPLTKVFEQIGVHRYLLSEKFHTILRAQAKLLIKLANVKPHQTKNLEVEYLKLQTEFQEAMNEVFGIDEITW